MPNNNVFSGCWKNQAGSLLEISVKENVVSGYYVSKLGNKECQNVRCPVLGFACDEIITFTVLWEKQTSLTTWAGRYQLISNIESIQTVWLLVSVYEDEELSLKKEAWESFQVNSSVFTKL